MTWPISTLESIYVLYPNKQNKAMSLKRISEALDRICEGEIDSKPRTPEEAVEFLRAAVRSSQAQFAGRDKHFIPHSTTYFNKSRYLSPIEPPSEMPEDLADCIAILAHYPTISAGEAAIQINIRAFLPALNAVQAALKVVPYSQLLQRVKLYAECVKEWPKEDRRYVPNAARFFSEHRFNQETWEWCRRAKHETERDQLRRLVN